HFVGDGAFRYLHVWPWGAQEGHGGGLSTVGTKNPVKRVFIARGLWESNRERALTVLRHEATEVNLWWEQATKLEDEKQIVNTDRKAEALAAVAALRGRPRKKSDVMVAADAKLPTIREWIRENALGAVVALTSRFHNMANRRYRTEHPLDFIPLPNTLNGAVAMVSWEHRDFFKRGGLGDAISEASYNLAKLGQDVDLYMPMHKEMEGKAAWEDTGFTVPVVSAGDRVLFRVYRTEIEVPTPGAGRLTVYALKDVTERTAENERWRLFQYGYNAPNDLRYFEYPLKESALGAKAVVEAMKLVHGDRRGRVRYRAVNAHDWQAALVPVFMKADTAFAGVGRILTVHNGAYMGNFRLKNDDGSDSYNQEFLRGLGLPAGYDRFGPGDPLEFHGQVVLQKAALLAAHKINPVSPQYRNELLSPDDYVLPGNTRDMAGVYRSRQADLVGVMNGLDHDIWNPERDPADPAAPYAYTPFVAKDVREKKPANKANFQKALGLTVDPDAPMMYACARLSEQKGFD
ncbi:MAG TPA: glycogen/starch synthase, partial [Elusimicrobiota bacterium]|nr:glycogen/starch synthase [Elusimicrobiota bacterium]